MMFRLMTAPLLTCLLMAHACGQSGLQSGVPSGAPSSAPSGAPEPARSDPAPAGGRVPSGLVQPSVQALGQALGQLRVDRWKTSKEIRQATVTNVGSIRRDLDATLPGLLTTADAAPNSVSALLPVSRNLGALYDVLLRVTVIAESAAPQDQTGALEQAMTGLEGARRDLSDRLQADAVAQEQQIDTLRKTLAARPAPVTVAPVPAPASPAPVVRPKRRKKPLAAPAPAPAPQ